MMNVRLPLLLLAAKLTSLPVAADEARRNPHFFFAGQSNMEGHVENFSSDPRYNITMDTLLSSDNDTLVLEQLVSHLSSFESIPPTPTSVYEFEARELIRLKAEGLLTRDFRKPLESVTCSFFRFRLGIDYRVDGEQPDVEALDHALADNANCGLDFGPELSFGHTMMQLQQQQEQHSDGPTTTTSIVKLAARESEIFQHWSKESGSFWESIVTQIRDIDFLQDSWKAIVWFQGENDAFDADLAAGYLGNLTALMNNLRDELHLVDPITYESPSDIPVAIIGMGCWISRTLNTNFTFGKDIVQAQRDFVVNDTRAVLIPTDDLSCHFHYDDASQLIIGHRVAQALQALLIVGEEDIEETVQLANTPPPLPEEEDEEEEIVQLANTPPPRPEEKEVEQSNPPPSSRPWVYTEPEWWVRIQRQQSSSTVPLKQCIKREFPPEEQSLCAKTAKTCFWGSQECKTASEGYAYPTIQCICNGRDNKWGQWSCQSVTCPPQQ